MLTANLFITQIWYFLLILFAVAPPYSLCPSNSRPLTASNKAISKVSDFLAWHRLFSLSENSFYTWFTTNPSWFVLTQILSLTLRPNTHIWLHFPTECSHCSFTLLPFNHSTVIPRCLLVSLNPTSRPLTNKCKVTGTVLHLFKLPQNLARCPVWHGYGIKIGCLLFRIYLREHDLK